MMKPMMLALALAAVSAVPALAQPSASEVAAAREFLEASRSRENFEEGFELGLREGAQGQLTEAQLNVVREVMREHFSWAELEQEYIDMYTDLLTEEEIRALTAFYRTPAGEKLADVTPEVAIRTQRIINERMQVIMPVLMSRMMEAMGEEP